MYKQDKEFSNLLGLIYHKTNRPTGAILLISTSDVTGHLNKTEGSTLVVNLLKKEAFVNRL